MGLSPLRLGLALVIGGAATGALYWTQQAMGHPPSASAAVAQKPQAPAVVKSAAPVRVSDSKPALPLSTPPRRIVFKHTAPGDVVLTVHGDELQVEFVSSAPKAPVHAAAKPPAKAPVKVSALPHLATPVATP